MAELKPTGKYRPRVAAVTGWTIFFFVLLRVAIGWHFLYEGFWKVRDGNFSATPYLLASQGPLKGVFRWMVFDADGFKRMEPQFQIDRINEGYDRISAHYRLGDEQKKTLDVWRKAKIEDLKSLGMSGSDIARVRCDAASRLASVFERYGDTLTSMTAVVTSPDDTVAVALDRIRQTGVSELPVFKDEQLVGIVTGSQLKTAASQPAQAGGEPLKVGKVIPPPGSEIKEFARMMTAADFQNALESYKQLLAQVAYEEARMDPKFRAQRLDYNQKKVSTARSALLARIEKPMTLIESVGEPTPPGKTRADLDIPELSLTSEQLQAGPLPPAHLTKIPGKYLNKLKVGRLVELRFPPKTLTFYIDLMMMFGLVAIGICLILGLFTRFAAFCAVLMLAMFYFSMPPWPGTVDPPNVEGHYLFVNKNLIELIACLMIMSSRVGRWFGLDAFLGAISDRRRRKRAEREAIQSAQSPKDRVYIPGDGRAVRETARV